MQLGKSGSRRVSDCLIFIKMWPNVIHFLYSFRNWKNIIYIANLPSTEFINVRRLVERCFLFKLQRATCSMYILLALFSLSSTQYQYVSLKTYGQTFVLCQKKTISLFFGKMMDLIILTKMLVLGPDHLNISKNKMIDLIILTKMLALGLPGLLAITRCGFAPRNIKTQHLQHQNSTFAILKTCWGNVDNHPSKMKRTHYNICFRLITILKCLIENATSK